MISAIRTLAAVQILGPHLLRLSLFFVCSGWGKFSSAPPLHSALVMAEMGNRVLTRSIAQSSVVLVGRPQPQQMLGRLAASQGHEVVSITSTRSLKERLGGLSGDWVLLLFVDAGGNEATVLSATMTALGRATVTYIVMRSSPGHQPHPHVNVIN